MAGFTTRTDKIMAMITNVNTGTATQNIDEQNQYYLPKDNNSNLVDLPIFTEDDVLLNSGQQSQLVYCNNNISSNCEVECTFAFNVANNESEVVLQNICETDCDLEAMQESRLINVPEKSIDGESNIDVYKLPSDAIQTGCDLEVVQAYRLNKVPESTTDNETNDLIEVLSNYPGNTFNTEQSDAESFGCELSEEIVSNSQEIQDDIDLQEKEDNDPDYTPELKPQDAEADENSDNENVRRRNKRHFVNEETWSENKKKRYREKGEEYLGKKKVDGKWIYNVIKEKRKIRPPCNCKLSLKSSALYCRSFSELERENIFTCFWSTMGWAERKVYVSFLVDLKEVKRFRNRVNETSSRRKQSLVYYLKKGEERVRVCKQMFLNTHGVKENMILDWITKRTNESKKKNNSETIKEDHVKSDRYRNLKTNLKAFFNELPKMESHYCRSTSTKLYLEPNWRSKSAIYEFYKEWCREKAIPFLSISSFCHVFEEMNLSLFQPKKDECDTCVAHRTGNLSQEVYEVHQSKKKEAREEKAKDKDSENKVFCMDLQSVLLAPKSNTSSLYFKTKLIVHNFTIFDLKTKDGYCYLWHESSGGVSANDYATIISRFIEQNVFGGLQPDQKVIIYSDGCTSQNRKSTLANALINLSVRLNITIEQKFLEKGHTQMEADSMHATIERKLRHVNINVPADYVGICLRARKIPAPYHVTYLSHDFFKDFSRLNFLKSLRPGKKVGDPLVTDIRALQYKPDSSVFYKLRHTDEFEELQYSRTKKIDRKNLACDINDLPQLYMGPIPIKHEKYLHLQDLKKSIEKDFHDFYDSLPFK